MKKSIPVAFVIATGEPLFKAIRGGIHQIDWTKFVYMFVFSAVLLSLTYGMTSKEKKSGE